MGRVRLLSLFQVPRLRCFIHCDRQQEPRRAEGAGDERFEITNERVVCLVSLGLSVL